MFGRKDKCLNCKQVNDLIERYAEEITHMQKSMLMRDDYLNLILNNYERLKQLNSELKEENEELKKKTKGFVFR